MKKISRKISKGKSPSYVTTPFPRGGGRVGVRGFFLFFLLLFLSANYSDAKTESSIFNSQFSIESPKRPKVKPQRTVDAGDADSMYVVLNVEGQSAEIVDWGYSTVDDLLAAWDNVTFDNIGDFA